MRKNIGQKLQVLNNELQLFCVTFSFTRLRGHIVNLKLNILYVLCRVFIPVSKGTKMVNIDQETQEL